MSWTYFVRGVGGGPIKIGFTTQPVGVRVDALAIGSPVLLKVLGVIAGDKEAQLHAKFAEGRLHGEWFKATPELLQFVADNASDDWVIREAMRSPGQIQLGRVRPERVKILDPDLVIQYF